MKLIAPSSACLYRASICGALAAAVLSAACGSSAAKSASTPSSAQTATDVSAQGMRGNRTAPPAVQTSIAAGTPRAGFGNRTPSGRVATAIAQGTPADAAGGGFGGPGRFGGGRALTRVATLLGIDETQLQSELQASGATIAGVAATHGFDRDRLKQALIDATGQRLADAVTSGAITQEMADQQSSQFETGIDALIDGSGGPPAPASSPQ